MTETESVGRFLVQNVVGFSSDINLHKMYHISRERTSLSRETNAVIQPNMPIFKKNSDIFFLLQPYL